MTRRLAAALLIILLVGLAACLPSEGTPDTSAPDPSTPPASSTPAGIYDY